jgi:hypothetical protein
MASIQEDDHMKLYSDLGGRLACFDHIGAYAQAAFTRSPRAKRHETPLTVWERLTKRDILDIENSFREFGIEADVMCDECAHNILAAKRQTMGV